MKDSLGSASEALLRLMLTTQASSWGSVASAAGTQAASLAEGTSDLVRVRKVDPTAPGWQDVQDENMEAVRMECAARAIQCGAHYMGLCEQGLPARARTPQTIAEIRRAYAIGANLRQLCDYARQLMECGNNGEFKNMIFCMSAPIRLPRQVDADLALRALNDLSVAPRGVEAEKNIVMFIRRAQRDNGSRPFYR